MQSDAAAAQAQGRVLAARVLALANQGMAGVGGVQADLVAPTGDQVDLKGRRAGQRFECAVARDRALSERRDARMRALFEDRELPLTVLGPHLAGGQRPVGLFHGARAEQALERLAGGCIAREEDGARDLAIEAMDGDHALALLGKARDEIGFLVAVQRHREQAGGLVGDQQVLIRVENRDQRRAG